MKSVTPSLELISKISPSKMMKIIKDPEKSATAVNLIYTSDSESEGIIRKKKWQEIHLLFWQ